jgi:hypothetical protein
MAVTNQKSVEVTAIDAGTILDTTDLKGRVRVANFSHTQSGAGDATSDIELVRLPAGRVRLLASQSKAYVAWATALATLDLGWGAYTDQDGAAVAADPNGIDDGIDVDTAGYQTFGNLAAIAAAGGTVEFNSQSGVTILATSQDVALADGDTIAGYFLYVVD